MNRLVKLKRMGGCGATLMQLRTLAICVEAKGPSRQLTIPSNRSIADFFRSFVRLSLESRKKFNIPFADVVESNNSNGSVSVIPGRSMLS